MGGVFTLNLATHAILDELAVVKRLGFGRLAVGRREHEIEDFAPHLGERRPAFEDALAQYRQRDRRFGGLSAPSDRSVGVA